MSTYTGLLKNGGNPDDKMRKIVERQIRRFEATRRRSHHYVTLRYKNGKAGSARKFDPLAVLKKERQYVITGLSGAGKSLVLERFYRRTAEDFLNEPDRAPLPLWVDLGVPENTADGQRLFVHHYRDMFNRFEELLQDRSAIVILDGINEMPPGDRADRAKEISAWLRAHSKLPVILSCRHRNYEDEMREILGDNLPVYALQRLNLDQVSEYVEKESVHEATCRELMHEIQFNEAVQNLATTPLHLSMLMELANRQERLPRRLRDLYDQHLNARYDHASKTTGMSMEWHLLKDRLRRLADKLHPIDENNSKEQRLKRPLLLGGVGADTLECGYDLHLLQRDVVQLNGIQDVRVKFVHQSIKGYFALWDMMKDLETSRDTSYLTNVIQDIGDLGDVARVAVDSLIDVLGKWRHDAKVCEAAIQSLTSIGPAAVSPLLRELIRPGTNNQQILKQIVQALGNIEEVQPQLYLHTLRMLDNPSIKAGPDFRSRVVDVLESIPNKRHHRAQDLLTENLRGSVRREHDFQAYLVDALGQTKPHGATALLINLLRNANRADIRDEVILSLGKIGDPIAAKELVNFATRNLNEKTRTTLAFAIALLGEDGFNKLFIAIRRLHHRTKDPDASLSRRQMNLQTTLEYMLDRDKRTAKRVYTELISRRPDKGFLDSIVEQYRRDNRA